MFAHKRTLLFIRRNLKSKLSATEEVRGWCLKRRAKPTKEKESNTRFQEQKVVTLSMSTFSEDSAKAFLVGSRQHPLY